MEADDIGGESDRRWARAIASAPMTARFASTKEPSQEPERLKLMYLYSNFLQNA